MSDTEPDPAANPDDPANQIWTTQESADAVYADPKTVQKWVDRGLLTAAGQVDGQNVFRGSDVLAAEKRTRRRPRLAALLAESRRLFRAGDATP